MEVVDNSTPEKIEMSAHLIIYMFDLNKNVFGSAEIIVDNLFKLASFNSPLKD